VPSSETQFKPGNPGRPRGARHKKTILREAVKTVAKKLAIEDLIEVRREDLIKVRDEIMRSKDLRLKHDLLADRMDRLFGKPTQRTEISGGVNVSIDVVSVLGPPSRPSDQKAIEAPVVTVKEISGDAEPQTPDRAPTKAN
jgi:hypothetical protein